ncbi:MAG: glycosyltransferase family 2 protein [Desulfobacterales bacterium]|nr:MAG: glycosyltransferase family 2 protein [Desulfobacterales bacterium]
MPEVSVIIPTFNRAKIVPKAIDSALQQTYRDYEIIVVDDGSTDNTKAVLEPYDDKIEYRYKDNGGISSARNYGIKLARGRYVALLDSDDYWLDKKIERQMACFWDNPSYGMVATRCSSFDIDGNFDTVEPQGKIRAKNRPGKSGWIYQDLFYRNFIRTSSVVIKRDCFAKVGLFDESLYQCNDVDMWMRMARAYQVWIINEPLTVYTDNPKGVSTDSLEGRGTYLRVLEKNHDPALIPSRLYKKRMARIYAHIGKHHVRRGDLGAAKQVLGKALSLQPLNFRALRNYGLAIWKER